jgi:hypothetical protein
MKQSQETLTWFQVNNWVPIIASSVMIAMSFMAFTTRLSVLENKMDNITLLLEKHQNQQDRLIGDLNIVHRELTTLQAIHPNK